MKYAVAVTLTKPIPNGSNIITNLNTYEAVSDAEARGLAFTAATEANPEHEVFSIAIVPVETQPETSRSPVSKERVSAIDAFEMGYAFAFDVSRPQSQEDSRAIGRLLGSERFKPIANRIDAEVKARGFNSFDTADAGIVAAKRIIHAALTPSPQPQAPSEERAREVLASELYEAHLEEEGDKDAFDWPDLPVEAKRAWIKDAACHREAIQAMIRFATDTQPVAGGGNEGVEALSEPLVWLDRDRNG